MYPELLILNSLYSSCNGMNGRSIHPIGVFLTVLCIHFMATKARLCVSVVSKGLPGIFLHDFTAPIHLE